MKDLFKDDGEMFSVPSERFVKELDKILLGENPAFALFQMQRLGMLEQTLPELNILSGMDHGKYHLEGDPFTHSLLVLTEAKKQTNDLAILYAALFHDIGKGITQDFHPCGKVTFHGHDEASARLWLDIGFRLRLPLDLQGEVHWLIAQHMRFHIIPEMSKKKQNALFFNSWFEKLFILGKADQEGRVPKSPNWETIWGLYEAFRASWKEVPPTLRGHLKERGYDGNKAKELGLSGPAIGAYLAYLEDAILEDPNEDLEGKSAEFMRIGAVP